MSVIYPWGKSNKVHTYEFKDATGNVGVGVIDLYRAWPTYLECGIIKPGIQEILDKVKYTAWCEKNSNGQNVIFIEIYIDGTIPVVLEGYDIYSNLKFSEEISTTKTIQIPKTNNIQYLRLTNKTRTVFSGCINLEFVCALGNFSCFEYEVVCSNNCNGYPTIHVISSKGPFFIRLLTSYAILEWGNITSGDVYTGGGVQGNLGNSECDRPGIREVFNTGLANENNYLACLTPGIKAAWIIVPGQKPYPIDLAMYRTKCLTKGGTGLPGGGGQP